MGDAVMATPALRSIRNRFRNDRISCYANKTVAQILSGTPFCDEWIIQQDDNPFRTAAKLKKYNFSHAVLMKNSFSSALAIFLAGIKTRTGFARDGRGIFLNNKLYAEKKSAFKYKPLSAIDYYLKIAAYLGGEISSRKTELAADEGDKKLVMEKFGIAVNRSRPLVILVPGGAFGPSKQWPEENFAKTADFLAERFSANVFVSVSPAQEEIAIADKICSLAKSKIENLGKNPLSLGQLKALFSFANLVITNDTGPRHIAIAFNRKVITLFGPNNPAWTANDYPDEIKIVGQAPCAPCDKPICRQDKHYCMDLITTEMVCQAAEKILRTPIDTEL